MRNDEIGSRGEDMKSISIVSGGQTGVDRGALDAGIKLSVPVGGWCPADRKAEDGRIPDVYPLKEVPEGGYQARTLKNVLDSEGTAIIFFTELEGGSRKTASFCRNEGKPYLLLNAIDFPPEDAAVIIRDFIIERGIEVLNVAGPRQSKQPRAYMYSFKAISRLLELLGAQVD